VDNKLWIFGDSFSTDLMHKSIIGWSIPYIKWKKRVPKTFPKILSDELGLDLINLAEGGVGNDTIFETIYKNAYRIQKNDIIIIGWSSIIRFRMSMIDDDEWYNVFPHLYPLTKKQNNYISNKTLEETLFNRTHPLYKKELEERVEFINWLFRDMKIIHWSWANEVNNVLKIEKYIENIRTETNGAVDDLHYSENGNIEIANFLLDKIKEKNEK
jgi:hypothetical protein